MCRGVRLRGVRLRATPPLVVCRPRGARADEMEFASEGHDAVIEGLKAMYRNILGPIEAATKFDIFYSSLLTDAEFDAAPMVLLIGPYSVGKTSFIKARARRERRRARENARASALALPRERRARPRGAAPASSHPAPALPFPAPRALVSPRNPPRQSTSSGASSLACASGPSRRRIGSWRSCTAPTTRPCPGTR